jgi:hypothetical protein
MTGSNFAEFGAGHTSNAAELEPPDMSYDFYAAHAPGLQVLGTVLLPPRPWSPNPDLSLPLHVMESSTQASVGFYGGWARLSWAGRK